MLNMDKSNGGTRDSGWHIGCRGRRTTCKTPVPSVIFTDQVCDVIKSDFHILS